MNRTISVQFDIGIVGFKPLHNRIPVHSNSLIMNPKVISQRLAVSKMLNRNEIDSFQL
ncbi:hypothetical protein MA16_Dca004987 [Dendrobium catenatum]|uniref:Uncharacterized protein n=1 Tax=Dendrobium catenatum TaxID=906689 RepID=A0A2I0WGK4_9ASPA|nr:hypothetical protein MA16_Dca004987 [Dendrobium catenatum]